ncbi:hypothetical protein [Paracholeplasma manati]|uniref:hypothetical protein n=1 Tax=Paracholeplasma manati TaxID=591373 RepID=UPI002407ED33|nr:hypothetical protein [Paracholeplasma manati]MDG0888777.1 hypothetical protein [Paracholeplasma manati]
MNQKTKIKSLVIGCYGLMIITFVILIIIFELTQMTWLYKTLTGVCIVLTYITGGTLGYLAGKKLID